MIVNSPNPLGREVARCRVVNCRTAPVRCTVSVTRRSRSERSVLLSTRTFRAWSAVVKM
jgi:hypothetical protein